MSGPGDVGVYPHSLGDAEKMGEVQALVRRNTELHFFGY